MPYIVRQGDQYALLLSLCVGPNPMNLDNVNQIEFTIGSVSKVYPGEVAYNAEKATFSFPLTQAETFALQGNVPYQARVQFDTGDVQGTPVNSFFVDKSISTNILPIGGNSNA